LILLKTAVAAANTQFLQAQNGLLSNYGAAEAAAQECAVVLAVGQAVRDHTLEKLLTDYQVRVRKHLQYVQPEQHIVQLFA
tara:strand:- start:770 stop:1012 length:243 start_codon:yes stop_codon:yes gene_type:complete